MWATSIHMNKKAKSTRNKPRRSYARPKQLLTHSQLGTRVAKKLLEAVEPICLNLQSTAITRDLCALQK